MEDVVNMYCKLQVYWRPHTNSVKAVRSLADCIETRATSSTTLREGRDSRSLAKVNSMTHDE